MWTEGLQTLFVSQRLGKGGGLRPPRSPAALAVRAWVLACEPHSWWGAGDSHANNGAAARAAGSPWASGGGPSLRGSVLTEASPQGPGLLFSPSGGVILLLLQTHGRETGRPSLLPGLRVAAQGVHASPKVTRHTDGCLLPGRGHMWICEGDDGPGPGTQPTGSGQLCPAAEKQDPPSCKLRFRSRLQAMHSPLALSALPAPPALLTGPSASSVGTPRICAAPHNKDQVTKGCFCAADWPRLGH